MNFMTSVDFSVIDLYELSSLLLSLMSVVFGNKTPFIVLIFGPSRMLSLKIKVYSTFMMRLLRRSCLLPSTDFVFFLHFKIYPKNFYQLKTTEPWPKVKPLLKREYNCFSRIYNGQLIATCEITVAEVRKESMF